MLIKEIYTLPDPIHCLVELRDGSLYTFLLSPSRKLTAKDLNPMQSPLPKELALETSHAKPYSDPLRNFQMKCFGLTDIPLKAFRQEAGMTQQQLADAAEINIRQIQKIESGEILISNMTFSNVLKLAAALGVDAEALI